MQAVRTAMERLGFERLLASRHLEQGGLVLYDLTSSYFEGTHCPLARFGHNRDGKRGKLQVNYGMLADRRGCPVAVSVFECNVSDGNTLLAQVEKVREDFGIEKLVLVGDRGTIAEKRIAELCGVEGLHWITAINTVDLNVRPIRQSRLADRVRSHIFLCMLASQGST